MNDRERKMSAFRRLTDTDDVRMKEELERPRVEMWFDDWSAWVALHESEKRGKRFTHFGVGHH
jgi:hypothetical protein